MEVSISDLSVSFLSDVSQRPALCDKYQMWKTLGSGCKDWKSFLSTENLNSLLELVPAPLKSEGIFTEINLPLIGKSLIGNQFASLPTGKAAALQALPSPKCLHQTQVTKQETF